MLKTMFQGMRRWAVRRKKALLITFSALLLLFIWAKWGPMDPLFDQPCSTVLLDRNGELLSASVAEDGQWRFPVSDSVPAKFITCITQFEDRHFFDHYGVHLPSLVRAVKQNAQAGHTVSGGSTLTMQLARMSQGNKQRSYGSKFVEALIALRVELRMSKQHILGLYASHAPFGGNVVGLDAAAWRWYGKPTHRLTWSESATLAVLPNAPGDIYPGRAQSALRGKRDRLLHRLLEVHAIDSTEFSLALEEPLPGKPHPLPQLATHLLNTLKKQGHNGERLHTTVDRPLQTRATELTSRYAERLIANEVHNAAVLIIDVPSGEVRAYIGNLPQAGADHAGAVDIVRASRSTGSLLKPFLYADMLQSGELTPGMLVADVPTRYEGFAPRNYDEKWDGAVPANEALARSLNVPAVRSLKQHGVARTLKTLREMGLNSIDRSADNYGLSLIVGGAESNLWELAGAYASMSRILSQAGHTGRAANVEYVHPPLLFRATSAPDSSARPPLSAASLWCTMSALREVHRPAEEEGWEQFAHQRRISWKTGTSYGHRDAWAIGVNDRWCVAVWTGNASGEGRPGLTGTLAAAPLLFDLFGLLPGGQASEPPYDELLKLPICTISGHRSGPDCPAVDTTWMPPACVRTPTCPYHTVMHLDEQERFRVPPGEGHRAVLFILPPAMEHYYAQRTPNYKPAPPWRSGGADDMPMEVLYPDRGARLLIPIELDGSRGQAVIEVAHRDANAPIHWDLDGAFIGTTTGEHRMALSPADGIHRVTLTDQMGHMLHHTFTVVSTKPDRPDR